MLDRMEGSGYEPPEKDLDEVISRAKAKMTEDQKVKNEKLDEKLAAHRAAEAMMTEDQKVMTEKRHEDKRAEKEQASHYDTMFHTAHRENKEFDESRETRKKLSAKAVELAPKISEEIANAKARGEGWVSERSILDLEIPFYGEPDAYHKVFMSTDDGRFFMMTVLDSIGISGEISNGMFHVDCKGKVEGFEFLLRVFVKDSGDVLFSARKLESEGSK